MGQILLWVGLIEMLAGWPAMMERVNNPNAIPGDFKFDPLGLGKGDKMARKQVSFAFVLGLFCGHTGSLLPMIGLVCYRSLLSLTKTVMARAQLVEIKKGRLALQQFRLMN
jgi:hypothetical protein